MIRKELDTKTLKRLRSLAEDDEKEISVRAIIYLTILLFRKENAQS
jgi:hypothetical protein